MEKLNKVMKNHIYILAVIIFGFGLSSCDDHFKEVNTNPNGITDVDPAHLFARGARNSFRNGISGS